MITELIVTSAPRGLQAGRSGFTTVMRTRGIHPDLATRLEAASGYRHTHSQGDPRNPVVFSYTNTPSAAGDGWVLSRVGDAGTDYTGRSNKIAHHIALKPEDVGRLTASNPALVLAVLAASGGLKTVWQGEPMESPTSPSLPIPPSQPGVCERWKAAAGDPGWAGVLVERALNKETTWVIAPAGTDILGLFAEALALAGPAQRWQIPFTTYSLNRNEGRWLGTISGTPEAEAARKQPRVLVIDLVNPGIPPTAGPYVQAARGMAPPPWVKLHSPQERIVAPQSTAGTASIQSTAGTHAGLQMRPDMVPPPIHAQPALPPTLKQWPGSLPEPSRPWYASAAALCVAGGLVLALSGVGTYRSLVSKSSRPSEEQLTEVQPGGVATSDRKAAKQQPLENSNGQKQKNVANESAKHIDGETSHTDTSNEAPPAVERDSSNDSNALMAPPLPTVISQMAEVAVGHTPIEPIKIPVEAEEPASTVLLRWPKEATSLEDVVLSIPAPAEVEGRFVLNAKPPVAGSENAAPHIVWECSDHQQQGVPIGFFTVRAKELEFTPAQGNGVNSSLSDLRLMPLFITHARDLTQRHWIRLGAAPVSTTVFASSAGGEVAAACGLTIQNETAALLLAHLRLKDGELTFPETAVGKPVGNIAEAVFGQSVAVAGDVKPTRIKWRPKHWADGDGGWMPASYKHSLTVTENSLEILSNLTVEHGDCFLSADTREEKFARRCAKEALGVPVDRWKRLVEEAFVCALLRQDNLPIPSKRDKSAIAQLDKYFDDFEQEIESREDGLLYELKAELQSFVGHNSANTNDRSRWCPQQNEPPITLDKWIDSLKNYLVAARVVAEAAEHLVPPRPSPLGIQSSPEDQKKHSDASAKRRDYVSELKRQVLFGDNASVHEWCEQVLENAVEPDHVRHVARLWVLFNNFRAEVRRGESTVNIARALRPNVSGEIEIAFPNAGGDVRYPVAVLGKAAGAVADATAPQEETEKESPEGDEDLLDTSGSPANGLDAPVKSKDSAQPEVAPS